MTQKMIKVLSKLLGEDFEDDIEFVIRLIAEGEDYL